MSASPRSPSSTSAHSNPLAIRLYKVLAANFDDEATKDALHTLAELYAPAQAADGPEVHAKAGGRGRQRVREDDDLDRDDGQEEHDDEEDARIQQSAQLPTLVESVPGEIAARARRSLRRDVESKLAESSRRFLTAFAEVDKVRLGLCLSVRALAH